MFSVDIYSPHQLVSAHTSLCQPDYPFYPPSASAGLWLPLSVSHSLCAPVSYCRPLVAKSSEGISDFNGTQNFFVKVDQRKLRTCEKFQECLLFSEQSQVLNMHENLTTP